MLELAAAVFVTLSFTPSDEPAPCNPETYEAALDCLDAVFNDETKAEFDTMPYADLVWTHFGLGRSIRNSWIYGDRAPVAAYMREMGFHHADDMSSTIIEGYWARRRGCTIDMEAIIAWYQSYWAAKAERAENEADSDTDMVEVQEPEDFLEDDSDRPMPTCPFPFEEGTPLSDYPEAEY